jgi:membrane protease YdiL (CAAX protease family)
LLKSDNRRRLSWLAVAGLLLAFGLPELGLPKLLFEDTAIGARNGREIVWVGFAILMLIWVTQAEKLPLSSVGLIKPTWATLKWGALATVLLMATVMLSFAVIAPMLGLRQNMAATAAIVQVPLWLFILTPVVAGVTEEILYRGYAVERLQFLCGRPWLAGVIAGAAFLLTHWSWGGAQMIIVGFATIILTGLYMWRRDLWSCILAHTAADLIGFTLARLQM